MLPLRPPFFRSASLCTTPLSCRRVKISRYKTCFNGFDLFGPMLDQEKPFGNILYRAFGIKLILRGVGCRKNVFFSISASSLSYPLHVCILRVNKWCQVILWYPPWCPLHSWPHISTLWATIVIHLSPKMAKKSWKTCFLAMLTSVTSYSTNK